MNQDTRLTEFFQQCRIIENSRCRSFFCESDEWPPRRQALYAHGVMYGLYAEKNKLITDMLKIDFSREKLRELFERMYYDGLKHLASFLSSFKEDVTPVYIHEPVSEPLDEWIIGYNYEMCKPFENDREHLLVFMYLYLSYDEYCRNESETARDSQPNISRLYESLSYGLIPINSERILMSLVPPRIYDAGLNKTVFIELKQRTAEIFTELYELGRIGSMSFRGVDSEIYDGCCEISLLLEEVERGRIFSLNINELPKATKLYSENFNDTLWIKSEGKDITFEELCDDFDVTGNSVTTQVIHLQYGMTEGGVYVITHIDHEYIYYTEDEYEERIKDFNVKGHGMKRRKTFKLDNANIPFDYPCNILPEGKEPGEEIDVPFIYYILDVYFTHKDLLREYFSEIL